MGPVCRPHGTQGSTRPTSCTGPARTAASCAPPCPRVRALAASGIKPADSCGPLAATSRAMVCRTQCSRQRAPGSHGRWARSLPPTSMRAGSQRWEARSELPARGATVSIPKQHPQGLRPGCRRRTRCGSRSPLRRTFVATPPWVCTAMFLQSSVAPARAVLRQPCAHMQSCRRQPAGDDAGAVCRRQRDPVWREGWLCAGLA